MSESCSGCRGPNSCFSGSGSSSLQYATGCMNQGGGPGCGCSSAGSSGPAVQPANRRVQIRAKVLYGSGKAIASLKAQEKAARH